MERLTCLASAFRDAIEKCDRGTLPVGFEKFPRGSCGDTASLLGSYLKDKDMGSFQYVKGERGVVGKDWQTHAWLEQNGTIVDITADQFPEIADRVIVCESTASEWHRCFQQERTGEADYRTDGSSAEQAIAYKTITREITL